MTIKTTRKKRSPIWRLKLEDFNALVKQSSTFKEILSFFGLATTGNYGTLRRRLDFEKIDYSHISQGLGHNKGRIYTRSSKPLIEILTKQSSFNRGHLKSRLLKEGILTNVCSICGIGGEWNLKPLTMILDHINGISDDNRLENLRMVCPNCNSQLPTHCGKNSHVTKKINLCPCGQRIRKTSKYCVVCSHIPQYRIVWPSVHDMGIMVWQKPMICLSTELGVSDNAIKKFCIKHNINRPPRGFWIKKRNV